MKAWLFDVDGVITNPEEKVASPQVLSEIAKKLEQGEPVALVTGRSVDFMRDRVINPLKDKIGNASLLQDFLAVGEKGGAWISYNEEGKEEETIDSNISVPPSLIERVRNLVNEEFSDIMFFDETKKTMISTEMNDGADINEYHEKQRMLNQKLYNLIGNSHDLKLDPTIIATDIERKSVGKDLAARRVLKWLEGKGIKLEEVIAFGDSKGDIPMAEEVYNQGIPVKLVFVGKPEYIEKVETSFPIIKTNNLFEKGTLEFLQNYS